MIHDSNDPEGVSDDGSYKPDRPKDISDDLIRARERKGIATAEVFIRTRSWDMAAEIGGYPTARAARVAAEKALEKEFHEDPRTLDWARRYMIKHYDLMLRSVASKASDPSHPEHLAAVKTVKELLTALAKLQGLDAPTRVSLIDPTEAQIQDYLNSTLGPEHTEEEADIFEAEVIEDRELGA